jgi:putative flippase GtrA
LTLVPTLPWFVSQSISFIFGVTNGFYWNRKWTFAANDHGAMIEQYPKFVATNVVGLVLNLLITKAFLIMFTGQMKHTANTDKNIILIASLCAIPLVVIWNFSASRLWTFKSTPSKPSNTAPATPPR